APELAVAERAEGISRTRPTGLEGDCKVGCATVAHPCQVRGAPVLPVGFQMSRSSGQYLSKSSVSSRSRAGVGAVVMAVVLACCLRLRGAPAPAAPGPVGAGFTVTAGDLDYILSQIKVAERHANTLTPEDPCGTLVGRGPNQIPDRLTPYGLRTVDGSCNNLFEGRTRWGSADELFPRLTQPKIRDAEGIEA